MFICISPQIECQELSGALPFANHSHLASSTSLRLWLPVKSSHRILSDMTHVTPVRPRC